MCVCVFKLQNELGIFIPSCALPKLDIRHSEMDVRGEGRHLGSLGGAISLVWLKDSGLEDSRSYKSQNVGTRGTHQQASAETPSF